ncbi:MAG: MSMEG_4193 family putative phosphomutase [Caldilineaceae bacterium]|nr:MSMEG_4193 family putative phosphomutase [Caldilineaceae bacterium]
MTYLFLIRHGENEWVETGKLAGRTPGVHLNEKGHQQSAALADRLAAQPISAIYSSPLVRCVETAQPLASRLGLSVIEEPGILEVDYGEWRGGELKELSKKPEWQLVQMYPSGFRFPGGETLREVQSRVVATLEQIRSQHAGQAVALFAHGDILRTTLAWYLGAPLDLFQRIVISTASVSVIGFHHFGPRILLINETGAIPQVSWGSKAEEQDETGAENAEAENAKNGGNDRSAARDAGNATS